MNFHFKFQFQSVPSVEIASLLLEMTSSIETWEDGMRDSLGKTLDSESGFWIVVCNRIHQNLDFSISLEIEEGRLLGLFIGPMPLLLFSC